MTARVDDWRHRRRRRQLAWAQVAERRRAESRYAVVHDIDGPVVRLGLVWFVLALAAVGAGEVAVAVLFAPVCAVAALSTSRCWMRAGVRPNLVVAGLCSAVAPAAAVVDAALWALVLVVAVVAASIAATVERADRPPVLDAFATIRSSVIPIVVGGAVVVIRAESVWVAFSLVALVAIYDAGDYLVGSGSANPVEGPASGFVGVGAMVFALWVVAPPGFEPLGVVVFGAVVAIGAPLGGLVASAVLPMAAARAPALRRLDSLAVVAPLWVALLWL